MAAPVVDYKIHWLKMMSVPQSRAVVGRHDGINGRDSRQWPLQRFAVTHKPFADALAVAAQDVALPVAALLFQVAIEGVPAREPGKRRHEVPPGIADHPLHIAFVVTLAGTAVAVLEEVMGLQPAERPRS